MKPSSYWTDDCERCGHPLAMHALGLCRGCHGECGRRPAGSEAEAAYERGEP